MNNEEIVKICKRKVKFLKWKKRKFNCKISYGNEFKEYIRFYNEIVKFVESNGDYDKNKLKKFLENNKIDYKTDRLLAKPVKLYLLFLFKDT